MAMFRAVCNLVDNTISNALIRWGGLNPNLAVVNYPSFINQPVQEKDVWLNDNILWTTPRGRRSVEKRMKRRFGAPNWGIYFGPRINKKIRVDHKTGEYFEIGKLAPKTYAKVMAETRKIQEKMADTFGVGAPKDEETLVLYKGEDKSSVKGRVVEMDYERPSFFSQNLMQKSFGKPGSDQETVKPSGLG